MTVWKYSSLDTGVERIFPPNWCGSFVMHSMAEQIIFDGFCWYHTLFYLLPQETVTLQSPEIPLNLWEDIPFPLPDTCLLQVSGTTSDYRSIHAIRSCGCRVHLSIYMNSPVSEAWRSFVTRGGSLPRFGFQRSPWSTTVSGLTTFLLFLRSTWRNYTCQVMYTMGVPGSSNNSLGISWWRSYTGVIITKWVSKTYTST